MPVSESSDKEEKRSEVLGAVLEEWQRPFLLIVSNNIFWEAREDLYLLRSNFGHVIFVEDGAVSTRRSKGYRSSLWPVVYFNDPMFFNAY